MGAILEIDSELVRAPELTVADTHRIFFIMDVFMCVCVCMYVCRFVCMRELRIELKENKEKDEKFT